MHFSTLASVLLPSIAAAAPYALELGYISTVFPSLPDGPGVGCGPWAWLDAQDGTKWAPDNGDALSKADECPLADGHPFCQRWGCEIDLHYDNGNFAFKILRDEGKNVVVEGWKFHGGWQTVTCEPSLWTVSSNGWGNQYRTNICYFDL